MGKVDTRTVMYGVFFGDPVKHSKSPVMLNRAFMETGINGLYAAFHVLPANLEAAVKGVRALNFRGINVTIPHKEEVMKYLDEIDEGARVIGAVNTIVNDGGRLIGYNTDGIGYVRSLKEETGISLAGKHILVIGAGGASRGITYALAKEGPACIRIANRTRDRAVELADELSSLSDCAGMGLDQIADNMQGVDLVINTTSAGMHPAVDELPMDTALLREGMAASDLIYNPPVTDSLGKRRNGER